MSKREHQKAAWLPDVLYNKLKAAAKRNFRSIGGEIEFRLTESFKDESQEVKR